MDNAGLADGTYGRTGAEKGCSIFSQRRGTAGSMIAGRETQENLPSHLSTDRVPPFSGHKWTRRRMDMYVCTYANMRKRFYTWNSLTWYAYTVHGHINTYMYTHVIKYVYACVWP